MLSFTDGDRWRIGIGDPTIMGWITVAAYFASALLCWRAARRTGANGQASRFTILFWGLLALLLLALGINKQLDLQTWLTLALKQMARKQGWYQSRRLYQLIFIVVVAVVGGLAFAALGWVFRHSLRENWLPLAGSLFLGCFVLVRAASFHHVDMLLVSRVENVKVNWLLEIGGIFCVGLGAARQLGRSNSG